MMKVRETDIFVTQKQKSLFSQVCMIKQLPASQERLKEHYSLFCGIIFF